MKQGTRMGIGVIAVAVVAAGGGYWLGGKGEGSTPVTASSANPAGEPGKGKLLYYRNPMGLPDTSPVPKKDPMGMDYLPVYAGEQDAEAASANAILIGTEKVQKLGVRTEVAQLRSLDRTVRAAGRIEPDERRLFTIAPKFEGYVERLHVNVTGQPVGKGQALFEVYSPELVSAQREYAIAAEGVGSLRGADRQTRTRMQELADASLQRLRNWDISAEQLGALAESGEAKRTLTFRSPVAGIVSEKKAVQGMRFMPGEALYQIADLSSVWVVADVFEQDIGLVKAGARAKVSINAYPDKVFEGAVTYVYPTLKAETRTVPVRVELANPGLLLKPSMFATVELAVAARTPEVTVPVSAVIDSGTRQIVLIEQGEGRFAPREVRLGARSDNDVEVVKGVTAGERVVVAANFLIDAESNLRAAIGGFGHPAEAAGKAAGPAGGGSVHRGEGTVEHVEAKAGTVTLTHDPIDSLKWPAMTMEFKVANESLLQALKPAARVGFAFVERQAGEWVITAVKPLPAQADAAASSPRPHAGH